MPSEQDIKALEAQLRAEWKAGDHIREHFPKVCPSPRNRLNREALRFRWEREGRFQGCCIPRYWLRRLYYLEWEEFEDAIPPEHFLPEHKGGRRIQYCLEGAIELGLLPEDATEEDFRRAYAEDDPPPDFRAMAIEQLLRREQERIWESTHCQRCGREKGTPPPCPPRVRLPRFLKEWHCLNGKPLCGQCLSMARFNSVMEKESETEYIEQTKGKRVYMVPLPF
jgi:hypothetical protein